MFVLFRNREIPPLPLGLGTVKAISADGYRLVWRDNGAIDVIESPSTLSFHFHDLVATGPSVALRWDLITKQVKVHRPWPGSSSVYVAPHSGCIVTTHLRFQAQMDAGLRPAPRLLAPGTEISIDLATRSTNDERREILFEDQAPATIEDAAQLLKVALRAAVHHLPADSVLLLSGGIDSAALAVGAAERGFRALTWVLRQPPAGRHLRDDVVAATLVARHCRLDHMVLELDERQLKNDIEVAVLLSETRRGTFIDDAVVYVQVAKALRSQGVTTAIVGEAADDVFGCLPVHLRFYQGKELLTKLRQDLAVGAPADHAAMRKIFSHFDIDLIDPYLSLDVARLGASLPLSMRVDTKRLMKPVLRKAFEAELPSEVVNRRKHVSRDVSGVKEAMARFAGADRERFLGVYNGLFKERDAGLRQQSLLATLD